MKIGGVKPQVNLVKNKKVSKNEKGLISDQVILGQNDSDLSIMKQPLESMKSRETMGTALVKIVGLTALAGVACTAAGAVGRTFGGATGVAIVTGVSALVGGTITSMASQSEYLNTKTKVKNFLAGSAVTAGLSLAGAGLGGIENPLLAKSLIGVTGAIGGTVGITGGYIYLNNQL